MNAIYITIVHKKREEIRKLNYNNLSFIQSNYFDFVKSHDIITIFEKLTRAGYENLNILFVRPKTRDASNSRNKHHNLSKDLAENFLLALL